MNTEDEEEEDNEMVPTEKAIGPVAALAENTTSKEPEVNSCFPPRSRKQSKFMLNKKTKVGSRIPFATPNMARDVEQCRRMEMESIRKLSSGEYRNTIRPLFITNEAEAHDVVGWMGDLNKFSVRNALSLLRDGVPSSKDMTWKHIWCIKAPQRICFFTWLGHHNCTISNVNRVSRGLASNSSRGVCGNSDETSLHILWDCPIVRSVWRKFGQNTLAPNFFFSNLTEWIKTRLNLQMIPIGLHCLQSHCGGYGSGGMPKFLGARRRFLMTWWHLSGKGVVKSFEPMNILSMQGKMLASPFEKGGIAMLAPAFEGLGPSQCGWCNQGESRQGGAVVVFSIMQEGIGCCVSPVTLESVHHSELSSLHC
ncbi:hypothetical protein Cgig2_018022 [Carnegiea gigantea]|uniref:Reverse transcriptase zinc-binding domain-containing protein n=1 Tax=Carnegiea gigantea TaxID=171969 RepID=A0A9Q1JZ31_9CARY|nr:hypothetical protein Cgig2_018022 [Carnegiea gigantea]